MLAPVRHGDGSPGVTVGPGSPVEVSGEESVETSLVVVALVVEVGSGPVSVVALVLVVVDPVVAGGEVDVDDVGSGEVLVLSSHASSHASTRGPHAGARVRSDAASSADAVLVIGCRVSELPAWPACR